MKFSLANILMPIFWFQVKTSIGTQFELPGMSGDLKSVREPHHASIGADRLKRSSDELQELFDDFWDWRMADQPQLATEVGVHKYDDKLNDLSLDSFEDRYTKVLEFENEALTLKRYLTNDRHRFYLNSLLYELQTFIEGYKFKGFLTPINSLGGIHATLENLLDIMPKETYGQFQNIVLRLKEIPKQIREIIELLQTGVLHGITCHKVSVKDLPEAFNRYIVTNPETSPLYTAFNISFHPSIEEEMEDLKEDAKETIEYISEAFVELKDYISNEYITRSNIAITSIPNGHEFYKQCIRYHTSTNLTAEEIHEIGLQEVKRISEKMSSVVQRVGHSMSVKDFSNYIKEDPRNYYRNSDDLLDACEDLISSKIRNKLNSMFYTLPESPIEVKENPLPTAGAAYHENPSLDGKRPGYFVIGTHNPKTWPKYSLLSLSLHEANPGHHLQASHVIESIGEPKFRKLTGAGVSYGSVPSQFPSYSYYLEGWALYAETLGFDMGLYTNPLDEFGHYTQELFRACRLVVDTGIHALGWSRNEAIEYMLSNIAFTRQFVENEIDRYITWPGQALSYKIGQLKIQELRRQSEEVLGDKFSLKDFHKLILDNFGSLESLEGEVNNWLQRKKNN